MERERGRAQAQQEATTGDFSFSSAPELASGQNFLQVRALMADIGALSLEDDEALEDDEKEKERNRELQQKVDGHIKELLQEAQREIEQLKRELKQVESVHKAEREGEGEGGGAGTHGRIGETDGHGEHFISAHLCLTSPFFTAHQECIQSSMQQAPVRIDLREHDLSHSGRVQSLPLIGHAHLPHSEQLVQKTEPFLQTGVPQTTQLQTPDKVFSSFQNGGPNQNLAFGEA